LWSVNEVIKPPCLSWTAEGSPSPLALMLLNLSSVIRSAQLTVLWLVERTQITWCLVKTWTNLISTSW
jgi:hypothetical protein